MTVQALRERRIETLAQLLDAHGRELQGVAYLILRDRALAEDVTIETLLTAFERGGSIRDDDALRAVAPSGRHEQGADRPAVGRAHRRPLVGPEPPVAARPRPRRRRPAGAARAPSATLPIQMRAAVVLRYYADLSVEGVAAALGKSPNTIKAQLQVALDRLRRSLAEPATKATETSHA